MPEPAKVIMKTELQFGPLFRKLYQKELTEIGVRDPEVTCIFTVGKDNAHWKNMLGNDNPGHNTLGIVTYSGKDEKTGKYHGSFLIDVSIGIPMASSAIAEDTRRGLVPTISTQSFNEYKFNLLLGMAHEYYHLIDRWRVGREKFTQQYTDTHNDIKKKLKQRIEKKGGKISDHQLKASVHAIHPDEQRAQQTAGKKIMLHRKDIENGVWDVALPMNMINFYYRKKTGR